MKKLIIGLALGFLCAAGFAGAGYRDYFQASDIVVGDDLTVTDDATVGGILTVGEGVISSGAIPRLLADVAVTLTAATSGSTYYSTDADGGTTTLPAVAAGLKYGFVMHTATTGDWIVASTEGDNIEGNLIVNSASIPCSGEDQVNFVDTIEEVSDYFVIYSDGTSWYIAHSDAVTTVALTCTDPS